MLLLLAPLYGHPEDTLPKYHIGLSTRQEPVKKVSRIPLLPNASQWYVPFRLTHPHSESQAVTDTSSLLVKCTGKPQSMLNLSMSHANAWTMLRSCKPQSMYMQWQAWNHAKVTYLPSSLLGTYSCTFKTCCILTLPYSI